MLGQYFAALIFYAVFSLAAFIGWPIARRIFNNFSSSYALSKIIGLAVFGYAVWLLSSLHFLNYQYKNIILAAYVFIAAVLFLYRFFRKENFAALKKNLVRISLFEASGLVLYLGYLYIRSFNAAAFGTEKFMDMSMLTAAGKTTFFPTADSWMAGHSINYYYYGHYLFSLLANLSHSIYSQAYNFSLALIFALSATLVAVLVYQLTRSKIFSALGSFFVVGAGSLAYAQCEIKDFFHHTSCYFGSSTRLTTPSYIINEIPSYSFTVGDLHAHLIALPFFLSCLFLLWKIFQERELGKNKLALLTISFLAGTAGAINSWDLVTLFCVSLLILLYKTATEKPKQKELLYRLLTPAGFVAAYVILFFPYWHNMKSEIGGLGFAPSFVKAFSGRFAEFQYPSPAFVLFGVWGVYVIGSLLILAFLKWKRWQFSKELKFSTLLFIASLFIIVGCELFFIKDIYSVQNPPYFRANTVFKFGYHAWTMLSISFTVFVAALFAKISELKPKPRKIYRAGISAIGVIFIVGSLVFPYQGLMQFYFKMNEKRTLDGINFMRGQDPDDAAAVNWINKNVSGRPVLVEAVGDSYTYFGRVSVFTGMINPVNWTTHEWTWRYIYPKMSLEEIAAAGAENRLPETGYAAVAERSGDVQNIYTSNDLAATKSLLQKYNAKYVYIGPQEYQTYGNINEQKFHSLGTVVYKTPGSELFEIK